MGREVGAKFRRAQHLHRTGKRGVSEKVQALKYFLESYNLHLGLSLEGEGQFIRLPYDDEGRYRSVNFKMSFRCHRLDQNTNKIF